MIHLITSGKGERKSRSTTSWRLVIISFAVSSPKRTMPSSMFCSSFSSVLSVSSSACSRSSTLSTWFSVCTTFSARIPERMSTAAKGRNSLRSTVIVPANRRHTANACWPQYTLGMISPKSNSKNVSKTVTTMNCSQTAPPKSTTCAKK